MVKHGQISPIHHTGSDLFKGVGEANAVRYHSLHVTVPSSSEIEVLAWADDGEENGKVTMAVKHRTRPFWAVQYHPESVKTTGGGLEVMRNFWRLANDWNKSYRERDKGWDEIQGSLFGPSWPPSTCHLSYPFLELSPRRVITKVINLPGISTTAVAEMFGAIDESQPMVLLDSAARPGRHSIVASLTSSSCKVQYYLGDDFLSLTRHGATTHEHLRSGNVWSWISSFMDARRASGGRKEVPFWGGFVGYLSYELGCTSLHPHPSHSSLCPFKKHPDLNLIFVERSVVIDHSSHNVYVQSIIAKDEAWVNATSASLVDASRSTQPDVAAPIIKTCVTLPDRERYISRIEAAKEHLAAGNSYELCLTAQTTISLTRSADVRRPDREVSSSWELFKRLGRKNPAPYAAYLRLDPSTVLSSSPERFLSFSRPPHPEYQLRPIKGTLRKSSAVTRKEAERGLVGSVKEVAENLMIVDLIRHDLHGVVGEEVEVKQFCGVEEYETVWQMVSVVEGKLPSSSFSNSKRPAPTSTAPESTTDGWNVLRHCLPPGSMTGAPKKRSVEILAELEDGPRGIYSGVLGYWDVGGGGDWSVVIRSCFKHRQDRIPQNQRQEDDGSEVWTVGAGGAITALSDPGAEWDEMVLKLKSVLGTFTPLET